MSKVKYISGLIFFCVILLAYPQTTRAASVSPIPDFDPGVTQKVTVDGLDTNTSYAWVTEKQTLAIFAFGQNPYSIVTTICATSDNKGQITKDVGPYSTPGYYRLQIYKAVTGTATCTTTGKSITSAEFSIGGPMDTRGGGQTCCNAAYPIYDTGKDVCKQSLWMPPLAPDPSIQTSCVDRKGFCESGSIQCFRKNTPRAAGKICIYKDNPDFDTLKKETDKYTVCARGGGKLVKDCTTDPDHPAIATAIGCIRTNPAEFGQDFLKFAIGIGGGLAFLMMLLGAFQMLTSSGNPDTLKAGRERLTSAVIGLLIVIFAVLFLQIIGVDILKLPGFGR